MMRWGWWRFCIFFRLLSLVWHHYPLVVNPDIVFKLAKDWCGISEWTDINFVLGPLPYVNEWGEIAHK